MRYCDCGERATAGGRSPEGELKGFCENHIPEWFGFVWPEEKESKDMTEADMEMTVKEFQKYAAEVPSVAVYAGAQRILGLMLVGATALATYAIQAQRPFLFAGGAAFALLLHRGLGGGIRKAFLAGGIVANAAALTLVYEHFFKGGSGNGQES